MKIKFVFRNQPESTDTGFWQLVHTCSIQGGSHVVQVRCSPNEPIILLALGQDYDTGKEATKLFGEISGLLEASTAPLAFVLDARGLSMGLDDIIARANAGVRMSGLFKHPRLRKTIVVTSSRLMELTARGMNSAIFGHVKMEVSKTLEEALDMARQ